MKQKYIAKEKIVLYENAIADPLFLKIEKQLYTIKEGQEFEIEIKNKKIIFNFNDLDNKGKFIEHRIDIIYKSILFKKIKKA